jgi:hypothetical protein
MPATKTVRIPSATGLSDATLRVTPGRLGLRAYTVAFELEDGGPGKWSELTVTYRTKDGDKDATSVTNTRNGKRSGSFRIETDSPVVDMDAAVVAHTRFGDVRRGGKGNILS